MILGTRFSSKSLVAEADLKGGPQGPQGTLKHQTKEGTGPIIAPAGRMCLSKLPTALPKVLLGLTHTAERPTWAIPLIVRRRLNGLLFNHVSRKTNR